MRDGGQRAGRFVRRVFGVLGIVGVLACLPAQALGAPPSRGFELVSPQDKNGGDLDRDILIQDWASSGAADAGGAVAYSGSSQFADPASGAPQTQYLSRRTGEGWVTRSISPPFDAEVLNPTALSSPRVVYLSSDLSRAAALTNVPLTDPAAKLGGSWGMYLWQAAGPAWRLISDPWASLGPDLSANVPDRFEFSGASEDMRHIVFASRGRQLTADGPPSDDFADGRALYMWSDGELEFVSVLPDGEPAAQASGGARAALVPYPPYPGDHLVSDDGQRVFFTEGRNTGPLYVRENGATTRPVSVSEQTGAEPIAQIAEFWAAEAATGSRAVFSSAERLTDDATAGGDGADVYLWDGSAPVGSRVTDLTTTSPNGAGAIGLAAASRDLRRVYFVAAAALTGDAVANRPNLYMWSEGEGLDLVAELTGLDSSVWSVIRTTIDGLGTYRDARTTDDGSKLLFVSAAQLTSYDNAGQRQVYLYDAATKDVTCVSCSSALPASTGEAGLFMARNVLSAFPTVPYRLSRNLSEDGSSVIFETSQALLPQDSNGRADVYEWRDGALRLVSSGQGSSGAQFVDASANGQDVFFMTRERLVKSDRDNQSDMYDARVGGGFPDAAEPVLCQGDACQGATPDSPAFAPPATSTFVGDGNAAPAKSKQVKKKKPKKCARGRVRKKVKGKSRCVKKPRAAQEHGRRR